MGEWVRKHHWDLYYEQIPIVLAMLRMCGRAAVQMAVHPKGALNRAAIGHEHFGRPVQVTSEKIEMFAEATNDTNFRYFGENQVAPPMFGTVFSIHSMSKLFQSEHLNLNFASMFHAGQDIEFLRLARPGEVIQSKSFVKKIVDKGKGEILVTNTTAFTDDGETIFRGYSSWYVLKPKALQNNHNDDFREQLYWEPDSKRTMRRLESIEVCENQMLRYAKISGDYNFVHISDWMARLFGKDKKILQGLCTMAFIAKALVNGLAKGNPHKLKRLNLRFLNNVSAGDVLETRCWDIDPNNVHWSSFWLGEDDPKLRLVGFKTINQHGHVAAVSRGIAKLER